MDIKRIDPTDSDACAAAVGVFDASFGLDCPEVTRPTPRGVAAALTVGWDGNPGQAFLARTADGTPAGLLRLSIPTWDNRDQAWIEAEVHPGHRGRGLDDELIEYGEQVAAELGRTVLGLETWDVPTAAELAERHGYVRKSVAVNRRQDLTKLDRDLLATLYGEAARAASAYELVEVTGRLPEELLEPMVAVTESINDAPTDDLDIEDDHYSPERLRAYEDAQLDGHGRKLYRVIARERATGELAGHTAVTIDGERPELGEQADTAVSPDHRGHRLGALLKTGMLRRLVEAEPQLTRLDTWNAESNAHMIGINERLGYQVVARAFQYQKKA